MRSNPAGDTPVNTPAPLTRVELNWSSFRFRTSAPLVAIGPFGSRPPRRVWTVADHALHGTSGVGGA